MKRDDKMRFVSARAKRRIEKKMSEKQAKKKHNPKNLERLKDSFNNFVNEESAEKKAFDSEIEKSFPSGSSVHVPTAGGEDDDLANQHERSVQPMSPPAELQSTSRSRGVIPPVVANLEAEVEKALNQVDLSSFYKAGVAFMDGNDPNDYSKSDERIYPAPVESGDVNGDNSDVGLYNMQNIVDGIDWESTNNTNGDEDQAKIYALDNLADDPDYYKKKIMEMNSTDDVLAKDVNENEEASVSDWPIALDLGSGHAREKGHVGMDLYPYDDGTIVHDLSLGIPAEDSSISKIKMSNSLEELDEPDQKALLSEIQRVLMPGGEFHYEGPNDIWNYPDWIDNGKMELIHHEDSHDNVEKIEGNPYIKQKFQRIAVPDAATADDAEPRIGIAQYDQLPADALLAMDALGYYWSDSTSSGRGNRLHGYPSQGALLDRTEENEANEVGMSKKGVEKDLSPSDVRTIEGADIPDYAMPNDLRYPINDLNQAVSALTACAGRAEEENVKNAVYRKFPSLKGDVTKRPDSEMENGNSSIVSLLTAICELIGVKKSAQSKAEKISKYLNDKKVVPIRKVDKKKQVAFCVVLSPEELDAQDDWMTADDIEDTAHNYMQDSRVIGKDHEMPIDATPVESYIAPQDMDWGDGPHGPQTVKKGSWVLGIKIHDPKEWAKVENGDYQGVSVGGLGARD